MRKLTMLVVACCLAFIAYSPEFLEAEGGQGSDHRECISICLNDWWNCYVDCEESSWSVYPCIEDCDDELDECEEDCDEQHNP